LELHPTDDFNAMSCLSIKCQRCVSRLLLKSDLCAFYVQVWATCTIMQLRAALSVLGPRKALTAKEAKAVLDSQPAVVSK
jgi:hypothetical protein